MSPAASRSGSLSARHAQTSHAEPQLSRRTPRSHRQHGSGRKSLQQRDSKLRLSSDQLHRLGDGRLHERQRNDQLRRSVQSLDSYTDTAGAQSTGASRAVFATSLASVKAFSKVFIIRA